MTYAMETKKRKFERLLESLTDGHASPARTAPAASNASSLIPSFGSDSSKRRRITPISKIQPVATASTASLTTHYLPSSRLAFLERLESFRQITKWHIPSTSPINAVEWAKRGWICQDTDTVSCPSCKERLHVDVNVEADDLTASEGDGTESQTEEKEDPMIMANAILHNLVKRYQDLIISAHTQACSWRRRGCDPSIQRIEGLLNTTSVISNLDTRYNSMTQANMKVPTVTPLPSSDTCNFSEQELNALRFSQGSAGLDTNTLRIAICGWQRKEDDIIECRHCFRSLGLWLYRGDQPIMEHLDAIDSHLEYCPWRSEAAQDTELSITAEKEKPVGEKMAGWTLVYLAIVKKNNRGKVSTWRDRSQQLGDLEDEDVHPQLSPEQREKRMKDLMKRIRDLKKPFNVKALLKRKDKSQQVVTT